MRESSTYSRLRRPEILLGIAASALAIVGVYGYLRRDRKVSVAKNLENAFTGYAPNILQKAYIYYVADQQARTHPTNVRGTEPMPEDMVKEHEMVHKERLIDVDDTMKVHVMFMHNGKSTEDFDPAKPTVICHHGIKGNWLHCPQKEGSEKHLENYRIKFAEELVEQGFNVILYSAPGFGKSTGKAGEDSYKKGAEAFAKYLKGKCEQDGKQTGEKLNRENVIVFGESMGTFKANLLLSALHGKGINPPLAVLVAPFDSAQGVMEDILPHLKGQTDGWWNEKCDSASVAAGIQDKKTKFLVLEVENDEVVKNERTDSFVNTIKTSKKSVEVHNLGKVGHIGWDPVEVSTKIKDEFESLKKQEIKQKKRDEVSNLAPAEGAAFVSRVVDSKKPLAKCME